MNLVLSFFFLKMKSFFFIPQPSPRCYDNECPLTLKYVEHKPRILPNPKQAGFFSPNQTLTIALICQTESDQKTCDLSEGHAVFCYCNLEDLLKCLMLCSFLSNKGSVIS